MRRVEEARDEAVSQATEVEAALEELGQEAMERRSVSDQVRGEISHTSYLQRVAALRRVGF